MRNLTGNVCAVVEELDEDDQPQAILLDSGADASVFPSSMLSAGIPAETACWENYVMLKDDPFHCRALELLK